MMNDERQKRPAPASHSSFIVLHCLPGGRVSLTLTTPSGKASVTITLPAAG
jgi:hypothetical protein